MEDEDKYNKRKRPGEGGRSKDPIKQMLDELQSKLPHIGNIFIIEKKVKSLP